MTALNTRIILRFFVRSLQTAITLPIFWSATRNYLPNYQPIAFKGKNFYRNFSDNIKNITSAYKSFDSKVNSLRTAKRKEILRIGVDDILGNSDLPEVTAQLSTLARGITSELFQYVMRKLKANMIFS
jgi:hypothetical protein